LLQNGAFQLLSNEKLLAGDLRVGGRQDDQIRTIFAPWVIIYFGKFFCKIRSSPNFLTVFFIENVIELVLQNILWLNFGRFFKKKSGHPGSTHKENEAETKPTV
jgi:hypothetical protein